MVLITYITIENIEMKTIVSLHLIKRIEKNPILAIFHPEMLFDS